VTRPPWPTVGQKDHPHLEGAPSAQHATNRPETPSGTCSAPRPYTVRTPGTYRPGLPSAPNGPLDPPPSMQAPNERPRAPWTHTAGARPNLGPTRRPQTGLPRSRTATPVRPPRPNSSQPTPYRSASETTNPGPSRPPRASPGQSNARQLIARRTPRPQHKRVLRHRSDRL
jgi:hypothetical protein